MDSTLPEAKPASGMSFFTNYNAATSLIIGAGMLALSFLQRMIPEELFEAYFLVIFRKFFNRFLSQLTIVVDEYDGYVHNELYKAAETYLATKISTSTTRRIKATKPEKENITVKMERNEEVVDEFKGVKFNWYLVHTKVESRNYNGYPGDFNPNSQPERKSFEVSFPKKHKDMVLQSYFPHIIKQAKLLAQEKRTLKLHTVNFGNRMYESLGGEWTAVNLDHPATFDTLAMDIEEKERIMKDLEKFVKRKEYYKKVGRAWKRGYLLYGPPGTGKSTLIAAMANYLKFDIFDLELSELNSNSDLRKLLIATANQSILVVEDIDCTIDLRDPSPQPSVPQFPGFPPQKQVTLSGFLNFIDGLWSSCGDERIIVFTTNNKEKLDPALLRPGRMDVHVHMSYCTPCGLRILANNYLGIKDHELFGDIEELIKTTQVTPAEVAEQLMRSDGVESALSEFIEFLRVKREENEEAKAKKIENDRDECEDGDVKQAEDDEN